jgi:hypothetical protein
MLLPDWNIFLLSQFHKVTNQSHALYVNIMTENNIPLIHDDM